MKSALTWKAAALSCLFGAVLLIGCATTPPVIFYTLTPLPPANQALGTAGSVPGQSISIGPVTFPDFLDRPQIVTRPSPNHLDISEFHRWGGNLKHTIPRILAEDIAACLDSDQVMVHPGRNRHRATYRVTVDIFRFDGRLEDAVDLVAVWVITRQKSESAPITNRLTTSTPVAGGGYAALVEAQSRALATLAEAIALDISGLAAGGTPQVD